MSRLVLLVLLAACGGEPPAEPTPPAPEPLTGPNPALLISQAWFRMEGGKPVPQPAKLVILRTDGERWEEEVLLDESSNVFHKAIPWRGGILTIGADDARLVHWTREGEGFKRDVLWERSWGGAFDRLRDLELGDVDGDGQDEIVLATHDQGVVAVGDETEQGWTFTEIDRKADTFVHEIELGDVDGDGKVEIYATPSDRNRATLESQPGGVARYDLVDGAWVRKEVASWPDTHAKEILVTGGRLYAVKEGHTRRQDGKVEILDPVRIVRLDPDGTSTVVASIDDQQTRFLLPGDVDGDGTTELLAAGMKSGLWLLEPQADGTFDKTLIDAASSGFEHATDVADLDGDGKLEIYVAADDQHEIRRYVWNGSGFDREVIGEIGDKHITWSIQDAHL